MTAVKHEKAKDEKDRGEKPAIGLAVAKGDGSYEIQWWTPPTPCTEGAIMIPTIECIDNGWVTGFVNITELQARLNGAAPSAPCKPCAEKAEVDTGDPVG